MATTFARMMPSTSTLLSFYASFSTTLMLLRNVYRELIPERLQSFILTKLKSLFSANPPQDIVTFIIDDSWDYFDGNHLLDAARIYLSTKIGPSNRRVRVGKFRHHKNITTALVEGEKIVDHFQGIDIVWSLVAAQDEHAHNNMTKNKPPSSDSTRPSSDGEGRHYFELVFEERYREQVLGGYLTHVLDTYEALTQGEKVLKLYSRPHGNWRGMDLRHPTTFDTIAMDYESKQGIVDDLDRFVARRDFYRRVGKAWKRGYLLHGPPGTGKSSLVAAMANYLNFDVYVLELGSIASDFDLKKALFDIGNKSIIVVEDIDCNSEVHSRSSNVEGNDVDDHSNNNDKKNPRVKFTLSTLLNCIDGLWSSRAEERIVVFTTNHKEVLDPALLRPGRMDMQIHLSYCKPQGFRTLASNYLGVKGDHPLFGEIDALLEALEVTPAAIAEELMKGDDTEAVLQQLLQFLKGKKTEMIKVSTHHEQDRSKSSSSSSSSGDIGVSE